MRGMHKAEVEWRDPVDILTAATQVERYSSKVRTVLDSGRSPMLSTVGQLVLHHISTVEKQLSVTPNKVCMGGGGYELAWNGTWHRSLKPRPVTFQKQAVEALKCIDTLLLAVYYSEAEDTQECLPALMELWNGCRVDFPKPAEPAPAPVRVAMPGDAAANAVRKGMRFTANRSPPAPPLTTKHLCLRFCRRQAAGDGICLGPAAAAPCGRAAASARAGRAPAQCA